MIFFFFSCQLRNINAKIKCFKLIKSKKKTGILILFFYVPDMLPNTQPNNRAEAKIQSLRVITNAIAEACK